MAAWWENTAWFTRDTPVSVWSHSTSPIHRIIRTSPLPCCDRARNTHTQQSIASCPTKSMKSLAPLLLFLLLDPRIVFDHNPNSVATREFKFKNIGSPAKDDAAAKAKLTLIDGNLDQGSA